MVPQAADGSCRIGDSRPTQEPPAARRRCTRRRQMTMFRLGSPRGQRRKCADRRYMYIDQSAGADVVPAASEDVAEGVHSTNRLRRRSPALNSMPRSSSTRTTRATCANSVASAPTSAGPDEIAPQASWTISASGPHAIRQVGQGDVSRMARGDAPEAPVQKPSTFPIPSKIELRTLVIGLPGPLVLDFCHNNGCEPMNSSSTRGVLPHR